MSLNKVMIIGNLGREPESRTTASGMTTANFSVAVNSRKKGANGEWEDQTEWFRVVCFDRLAERAVQYLAKGRQVYVEGRLQTRSWNDKNTGEKRTAVELIATSFELLGPRPAGSGGEAGGGGNGSGGNGSGGNGEQLEHPSAPAAASVGEDEDLPF